MKIDQMWSASFYNEYATAQAQIAKEVLQTINFKGNEHVLDIGCGNGATTALIANKYTPNGSVLGIDLSSDMINFARAHFIASNLEFKRLDACELSTNNNFDFVFSFYCFHWIANQAKVFKNISNSLNNAGKAIIYTMADATDSNYSITKFITDVIGLPKWKDHFKNYKNPWHFQTVQSATNVIQQANLKPLEIELLAQEIIFKDKQQASLWLSAVPIAAQVPADLQPEFMNDLIENYFKLLKIRDDNSISFILPTLKIVAQK